MYGGPDAFTVQLADLARSIKANPQNKTTMYLLGYQLFVTGEKDKAKAILESVARQDADDSYVKPFFDFFKKSDAANAEKDAIKK